MHRFLVFALLFGLGGCVHRVAMTSDPVGAEVILARKSLGVTPLEFKTVWWPVKPIKVNVRMTGYRTMTLDLHEDTGPVRLLGELLTLRWRRLTGRVPRTEHTVILVPHHGKTGTWTPEEARQR